MSHRSPLSYSGEEVDNKPPKPKPPHPSVLPSKGLSAEVLEQLAKLEEALNAHPKNKPLDSDGREIPDPRPVSSPIGYVKQPSMVEHIRTLVRGELLRHAAEATDMETFEEADDLDDDEDDGGNAPRTPYEAVFDPPPPSPAPRPENPPTAPSGAVETAPAAPNPTPAAGS